MRSAQTGLEKLVEGWGRGVALAPAQGPVLLTVFANKVSEVGAVAHRFAARAAGEPAFAADARVLAEEFAQEVCENAPHLLRRGLVLPTDDKMQVGGLAEHRVDAPAAPLGDVQGSAVQDKQDVRGESNAVLRGVLAVPSRSVLARRQNLASLHISTRMVRHP